MQRSNQFHKILVAENYLIMNITIDFIPLLSGSFLELEIFEASHLSKMENLWPNYSADRHFYRLLSRVGG